MVFIAVYRSHAYPVPIFVGRCQCWDVRGYKNATDLGGKSTNPFYTIENRWNLNHLRNYSHKAAPERNAFREGF